MSSSSSLSSSTLSLPATLPTIPASWTAPTSCFASTNYYYVLWDGNYFSNMYGTPTPVFDGNTPSGDCFPPSRDLYIPYETDGGCPKGFTVACKTGGIRSGEQVSTITCCPRVTGDVFSFMCKNNEYGCHATATPNVTWTGVQTYIDPTAPIEAPVTRTPGTAEGIEAWGIKLLSVPAKSTSMTGSDITAETAVTSATTTGATSDSTASVIQDPEQPGLTTGAIAGIAVGAAAGVVLLIIGAFLLYRNKQKKDLPPTTPTTYVESPRKKEIHQLGVNEEPQLLDPQDSRPGARPVWEMPG